MINNTKIQVDYTTKTKNFQLVFPINFEINIPADDLVRLLSSVRGNQRHQVDIYQKKLCISVKAVRLVHTRHSA